MGEFDIGGDDGLIKDGELGVTLLSSFNWHSWGSCWVYSSKRKITLWRGIISVKLGVAKTRCSMSV